MLGVDEMLVVLAFAPRSEIVRTAPIHHQHPSSLSLLPHRITMTPLGTMLMRKKPAGLRTARMLWILAEWTAGSHNRPVAR
jgi:hypothetical protein